jgi:RNA polymerase sigma-70 factor (ECF subfamily)
MEQSDAALVRSARSGDARAFGLLYERHGTAVFRYLLLRSADRQLAEDLSQDVFEAAMDGLAGLREPAQFRAWLMRIAHNRLQSHWSRQRRRPDRQSLEQPLPQETASHDLHEQALDSRLRVEALMVHDLGEREQRLLALRFGAGLPLREIAAQLGCSEPAARQLQYRALKRLREKTQGGGAP